MLVFLLSWPNIHHPTSFRSSGALMPIIPFSKLILLCRLCLYLSLTPKIGYESRKGASLFTGISGQSFFFFFFLFYPVVNRWEKLEVGRPTRRVAVIIADDPSPIPFFSPSAGLLPLIYFSCQFKMTWPWIGRKSFLDFNSFVETLFKLNKYKSKSKTGRYRLFWLVSYFVY